MNFRKEFWDRVWRRTGQLFGSLSKDVFERRTSTGSGLFSFLGSSFSQIFGEIVFIRVKTLSNTNQKNKGLYGGEKDSLPVTPSSLPSPLVGLGFNTYRYLQKRETNNFFFAFNQTLPRLVLFRLSTIVVKRPIPYFVSCWLPCGQI